MGFYVRKVRGIDNNESMNRRGAPESLYSTGLQHPSYATDSNVLPFFSFIYILWHRGWITDWNVVCVALKTPFAPSAFPKQSQQIHLFFSGSSSTIRTSDTPHCNNKNISSFYTTSFHEDHSTVINVNHHKHVTLSWKHIPAIKILSPL